MECQAVVETAAGLQCKVGCPEGHGVELGLEGGEGVSWGYAGKRVLGRGTSGSLKLRASLGVWGAVRKLVWPGQVRMGRNLGTEARPCSTLETTVSILAFTLNDSGSRGGVLSGKMTWFRLTSRRICVKNELLRGERAAIVIQVRADGSSHGLMALFLSPGSDFRFPFWWMCFQMQF